MDDIFKGLEISEDVKGALVERIELAKKDWQDGVKNDAAFIKSIKDGEAGKFFNSMESVFKRNLDISFDEIDENLKGLKRQEAILKLGLASLEKNKDKTNQELQQQYLASKAELDKFQNEILPAKLLEKEQEHQKKYIDDGIFKDVASFKDNILCNVDAATSIVKGYLSSNQLNAKWENGNYDFFTSENLKPTKDDKPLTKQELIKDALISSGVFKHSNGSPSGSDGNKGVQTTRTPGKLSQNAEAMKASFANAR